ncbi:dipeptide/oligopeptide/nickel ABC transporter permease/ATP-binding protein [Brachybacterium sp. Marseille-Q7125]|uniref:dipeptide/oligopeptide/nickel ABC transporter permease/ATP-binding protein n=1 Tax=Brachybacterium sp. Marseille-Q7125 TaxID=2932815 RepID=UPI001FF5CCAD|nr:dipeptide/oligopeptide/nickel ABC transporter permease/ATP-binding protein [Brachybacterium sp. Marseille-Q7125]
MSRISRFIPTSGKVRAGLVIVIIFVLIAIFGPMITPYGPRASGPEILSGPSAKHWFGTTQLGQDVFSQFVHGARVSLLVGLFAGVFSQIISVVVGLIGGYLRGTVDDILYILTSVFLVIPGLPLLVVLTGWLPTQGMVSVAIVITITSWAGAARVLRAQTLSLRNRDFVEAARATGESRLRIIFAEILPNALPIAVSGFIFSVIGAILAEAGLSFLGIGSLTTTSWGSMLYFAQNAQALRIGAWWWFIPPGFAISAIGAGLALINFGIDEYANPRLRTERSRAKSARPGLLAAAGGGSTEVSSTAGGAEISVETAPAGEAPVDAEEVDQHIAPSIRPVQVPGEPIITVENLVVDYPSAEGTTRAVDDVSITLHRGELLGLAGESGSGKSTLTNAITRLLRNPAKVVSGSVTYHRDEESGGGDVDMLALDPESLRAMRWTEIAIVFQSAMNALNPVITVGAQFDDVIAKHRPDLSASERRAIARDRLVKVGIDPDRITSYPHELSGGMKQRVAIAIALVLDPDVIIMDEPTTALDLLVQREVLDQIMALRETFGFAIIFTTHDLSLLLEISDSIAIMQRGKLVEYGPAMDVYTAPGHPYTRMLLQSLSNLGAQL